jgi:hypothetical protein
MSVLRGIVPIGLDSEQLPMWLTAGNLYPFRTSLGPLDAGVGSVLSWGTVSGFTTIPNAKTGLHIQGDVRGLVTLRSGKGRLIAVSRNDGPLQLLWSLN